MKNIAFYILQEETCVLVINNIWDFRQLRFRLDLINKYNNSFLEECKSNFHIKLLN